MLRPKPMISAASATVRNALSTKFSKFTSVLVVHGNKHPPPIVGIRRNLRGLLRHTPPMPQPSAFATINWQVATDGYCWLDAMVFDHESLFRRRADLILPTKTALERPTFDKVPSTLYAPMNVPTLHREFADVATTREGIGAFCQARGMLGPQQALLSNYWNLSPGLADHLFEKAKLRGEARDFWTYHVTKVRTILRVHDALRKDNPQGALVTIAQDCPRVERAWFSTPGLDWPSPPKWFTEVALVDGDTVWSTASPYNIRHEMAALSGERPSSSSESTRIDPLLTISPKDMRSFIQEEVNFELSRGTYPSIRYGKPGLRIEPRHLLGAIYAHVALDLSGEGLPLMRCSCGTWFERPDTRQVHCSSKCRTRSYRGKKRARTERVSEA